MKIKEHKGRRRKLAEWVESNNASAMEAAKFFGCSPHTVRRACEENNVEYRRAQNEMVTSPSRIRRMIADLKGGMPIKKLCRKHQCDYRTVKRACENNGIRYEDYVSPPYRRDKKWRRKVAEYVAEGNTLLDAIREFETSYRVVHKACAENNVSVQRSYNHAINASTWTVLEKLFKGESIKQIAIDLDLSESHIRRIRANGNKRGFPFPECHQ